MPLRDPLAIGNVFKKLKHGLIINGTLKYLLKGVPIVPVGTHISGYSNMQEASVLKVKVSSVLL